MGITQCLFPCSHVLTDTATAFHFHCNFIRKLAPKGQGAKCDVAGSRAEASPARPRAGQAGGSSESRLSGRFLMMRQIRGQARESGPGSMESIGSQGTAVAKMKGHSPMVLLRWGLTPLCLQNLHSVRETRYMQCWF